MPNFAALYSGNIDALAKAPPSLPPGDYPAVLTSYEHGEVKNENKTPYLRFHAQLQGWPTDVTPVEGVEIGKRKARADYFFGDAIFRLAQLCQSCGVTGELNESTPGQLVGKRVLAVMVKKLNTKTGEYQTFCDRFIGAEG